MVDAVAAFLAVIAYAEGTGDRYDITFSYHKILDMRDHPGVVIKSGKYHSSAAGRYQFLYRTWRELQEKCFGLTDFGPASQDSAALCLLDRKGVQYREVLSREQFETEIKKVNKIWASLPGSPYGQPTKSMDKLWDKYNKEL